MVALPSSSSKMGFKSRNRSPYQRKIPGVYHNQRSNGKVSGYQKPTYTKRSRQRKELNEFAFQNHLYGLKRDSVASKQNPNQQVFNHQKLPISDVGRYESFNQNSINSIGYQGGSSYYTNNPNVSRNILKQPFQQTLNSTSYNTEFIADSNSSPSKVTAPFMNYFTSNGVQNSSIKEHNDQNSYYPLPFIAERGIQINDKTNKLLLSLDRDLINLVSGTNSEIPLPQLSDKASLKLRRQNVIDSLYNKEDNQCPHCGLRISKDENGLFQAHLDEHFRKKSFVNKLKRGELQMRREWYPNFAKIKSVESQDNTSNYKKEPAETIPMICIDDIVLGINKDIVKCNLCYEEFDQVYINDQELLYKTNLQQGKLKDGWYLKNAIWTGSSDVVHPSCLNE